MVELQTSGLTDEAAEVHVGVNGTDEDLVEVEFMVPVRTILFHNENGVSEIPTINRLREWLPGHEDWYVCYHHGKCCTRNDETCAKWRRAMQNAVITNWRQCVADLDAGAEAVGCHWLTPEAYPGLVGSPYFAGTFWWATARFLLTLPPLPKATWENRYYAESWIGSGPARPKVKDYKPGWPMP
jgi:hypothetical protein